MTWPDLVCISILRPTPYGADRLLADMNFRPMTISMIGRRFGSDAEGRGLAWNQKISNEDLLEKCPRLISITAHISCGAPSHQMSWDEVSRRKACMSWIKDATQTLRYVSGSNRSRWVEVHCSHRSRSKHSCNSNLLLSWQLQLPDLENRQYNNHDFHKQMRECSGKEKYVRLDRAKAFNRSVPIPRDGYALYRNDYNLVLLGLNW